MAFDPNLPANNSLIDAAEIRSQFTGLQEEMSAMIAEQTAGKPDMPTLALTISNPPTQQQVQAIVEAFNNLLDALKRV